MTTTPPDGSGSAPETRPERPRFGEYAPEPSAPVQATPPVYPPAAQEAPVYQAPIGGVPGTATAPSRRSTTLGVVALVVGLVVLIGAPIASGFVSQGLSPLMRYYANGGTDVSSIPADQMQAASGAGVGAIATILFCAVFGLWALVQGIIATAKNRGRAFGIMAIIFSLLAPVASIIVFYAVLVATVPELFQP